MVLFFLLVTCLFVLGKSGTVNVALLPPGNTTATVVSSSPDTTPPVLTSMTWGTGGEPTNWPLVTVSTPPFNFEFQATDSGSGLLAIFLIIRLQNTQDVWAYSLTSVQDDAGICSVADILVYGRCYCLSDSGCHGMTNGVSYAININPNQKLRGPLNIDVDKATLYNAVFQMDVWIADLAGNVAKYPQTMLQSMGFSMNNFVFSSNTILVDTQPPILTNLVVTPLTYRVNTTINNYDYQGPITVTWTAVDTISGMANVQLAFTRPGIPFSMAFWQAVDDSFNSPGQLTTTKTITPPCAPLLPPGSLRWPLGQYDISMFLSDCERNFLYLSTEDLANLGFTSYVTVVQGDQPPIDDHDAPVCSQVQTFLSNADVDQTPILTFSANCTDASIIFAVAFYVLSPDGTEFFLTATAPAQSASVALQPQTAAGEYKLVGMFALDLWGNFAMYGNCSEKEYYVIDQAEAFAQFQPTWCPASTSGGSPPPSSSSNSTIIIAVVIAVVGGLLLITFLCCFLRRRGCCKRSDHKEKVAQLTQRLNELSNALMCGECKTSPATFHCDECQLNYCVMCFGAIHRQVSMSTHTRRPLAESISQQTSKMVVFTELTLGTVVGQGNSATVHAGRWRGTEVAVKIPRRQTESSLEELKREADMCVRVGAHPRVISYFGAALDCETPCLVFELAPNGSIEELVVVKQSFKLYGDVTESALMANYRAILQMALDASSAIFHLHSQNIIHRDIAARNFLVNAFNRVSISDFGMSIALEPEVDCYQGESKESVPVAWCSPESLASREFSKESDVYAFGIFLAELIMQREPYPGMKLLSAVAPGVVNEKKPLRPEILGHCPVSLRELMQSCWAHNYKERPNMMAINQRLKDLFDTFSAARQLSDVGVSYADSRKIQPPSGARALSEQQNRYDSYQVKLPANNAIQLPRYYARPNANSEVQ